MQAFLSPSLLFALLAANHHCLVQRVVNKQHCAVCADSKWYLLFQKSGEGTQQKQGWSAQPCGCAASQKPMLGLWRSVWLKNSKVSFITLKSLGGGPCTGPGELLLCTLLGGKGERALGSICLLQKMSVSLPLWIFSLSFVYTHTKDVKDLWCSFDFILIKNPIWAVKG